MGEEPSIWYLLGEHLKLAKKLRYLKIEYNPEKCKGIWECYQVCPVNCWQPDYKNHKVEFQNEEDCIACGACVLQCPEGAIRLI